ncbi:BA75_01130T0 [Komagataella pastoris]|uniref:BA75_01130T0 n=1 Tax=Komagataella pastoris TaxID=4922 RepID=A0A1B2J9V8_PICPA|nr:BA75_01130T0 [Komagataella pastoris]
MSNASDEETSVFEKFHKFDFTNSKEYQDGLLAVYEQYLIMKFQNDPDVEQKLRGNEKQDIVKLADLYLQPSEMAQLQNQAKVYYFCSETGNILSLDDYQKWEVQSTETRRLQEISSETAPHSSKYEDLVDLIVQGKPIPGIKNIPDMVHDSTNISQSSLELRKKPWET